MIDFSTLQGLTIPEGVVTQIADAGGRVLWELETTKIFYLRPSMDIDVSAWTLYPEGSASAYSLLNEEVADDDATYISRSVPAGNVAGDSIEIGCTCEKIPNANLKITSGRMYVWYKNTSNVTPFFRCRMEGVAITELLSGGYEPSTYHGTSYEITAEGISKINQYIAANRKFPMLTLYEDDIGNGGTKSEIISISQVYIELISEA